MRGHAAAVALLCSALTGAAWSEKAAEALGDAKRGAEIFARCASCHDVGAGAKNRVGPQLNGIVGRPVAALAGFAYSEAMRQASGAGLVWDMPRLAAFLEDPGALIPGTRMDFAGLADPTDRADVLAYLTGFPERPAAQGGAVQLPPEILAIEGDLEYGEYLSSDCTTCHQRDGSDAGIPSITNWPVEDFVIAMHAYKRKIRPHPVMQMMAARLSDEEIAALAAYFASLD